MNICCTFVLVGPSGLEPPTSCLSGTRSNLLSYDPVWLVWRFVHTRFFSESGKDFDVLPFFCVSIELFSRTASRKVSSPLQSLTSVFGMGTGGPSAFVTLTILQDFLFPEYWTTFTHLRYRKSFVILSLLFETTQSRRLADCTFSIERRWSSRTFRYGYLVTT